MDQTLIVGEYYRYKKQRLKLKGPDPEKPDHVLLITGYKLSKNRKKGDRPKEETLSVSEQELIEENAGTVVESARQFYSLR